ncbi:MAG TPA: flavodoxin family protein [Atribacteraceae bacterium]|nr:flavodoxin family protein [Atribacteraceae bacterium]
MKTLIVCVSENHGNTAKIARALGEVLDARIEEPEKVTDEMLHGFDLVGFGSGIFIGKHHKRILELSRRLSENPLKAFIFSTSGWGKAGISHKALRKNLEEHGFSVIGDFACKGYDTYGPLKLVGGINKNRPNKQDLNDAREFARSLLKRD